MYTIHKSYGDIKIHTKLSFNFCHALVDGHRFGYKTLMIVTAMLLLKVLYFKTKVDSIYSTQRTI